MESVNIIVGHSNMDLDCIGSIALSRYLFPGHTPVRSGRIHPVARNLYNLYEAYLDFSHPSDLKGFEIGEMVVLDTRSSDHVEEYLENRDTGTIQIEVFDHHPKSIRDIPGAIIHECRFGANTTQIGLLLMQANTRISQEDATIALTAIYADTGNFLHPNVCPEDLEVASFLLAQGAELSLIKGFLVPLRDKTQITLFHEVLNKIETRLIRGHKVQVCYLEMEEDSQGMGAVVEKVFEVENCEILFGFFFIRHSKRLLIIARNSCADIHLNEILADFGGGGHKQAASATIKTPEGFPVYETILAYLAGVLAPAACAGDIMTREVFSLKPDMNVMQASLFLEDVSHSSAPVVDSDGKVVGFLSLSDIMKARKLGKMMVPVTAFMTSRVVCARTDTTLREIEEILYHNNTGRLPITDEGKLVGIVTRSAYLAHMRAEGAKKRIALLCIG